MRAVVERTGLDPARIDDVVFAQSYANGETPCVGRWAALQAGLPIEVPGMQLDRRCGGGLQAIVTAAMMVETGAADVVIAGGVESMSNIEYYTTDMRWGARAGSVKLHDRLDRGRERSQPVERFGAISGMIETAENLAQGISISRAKQPTRTRCAATSAPPRHGKRASSTKRSCRSRCRRRRASRSCSPATKACAPTRAWKALAKLRPIMKGGTVTAGNASQQNDAAAACLVVAEDKLEELELEADGLLDGWAAAGCHPATMGIGPVPAVRKLFARRGRLGQMDLVELNEAFACQVLAVLKGWGWNDPDRLNVNGSGISLGHPIGATACASLTMLHELERRNGRYGLETMCIGGGQGMAAIFERI